MSRAPDAGPRRKADAIPRLADFLDIAVMAVLLYLAISGLRRRASPTVVVGAVALSLVYVLARRLGMHLTLTMFQTGLTALLVTLVLIFQADIRREFDRIASFRFRHTRRHSPYHDIVSTLVQSAANLAKDRTGALIVLKGREPVDPHVQGGIRLGGKASGEILQCILTPGTPGHDGAVLLNGEQIDRFGVYLPLSRNTPEGVPAGTRHAAALGLSEACDALVIVVSEERGTISIAHQGELNIVSAVSVLGKTLEQFLASLNPRRAPKRGLPSVFRNPGTKILALGLATLMWFMVAFRLETVHRTFSVPVELRNVPAAFTLDGSRIPEARVVLSGSERDFVFGAGDLVFSVDLSHVKDGVQEFALTRNNILNVPPGISVQQIVPGSISVNAREMVPVEVPVRPVVEGKVHNGYDITEVKAVPATVKVRVPRRRTSQLKEVRTQSISVAGRTDTRTDRVGVVLPDGVMSADGETTMVNVKVSVDKLAAAKPPRK